MKKINVRNRQLIKLRAGAMAELLAGRINRSDTDTKIPTVTAADKQIKASVAARAEADLLRKRFH